MADEHQKTFLKPVELVNVILGVLDESKAKNIERIDVTKLTDMTDFMIIASGTSHRHVHAMGKRICDVGRTFDVKPIGVEGDSENEWILIDYVDVIVHLMMPPIREFYSLERLWNDRLGEIRTHNRHENLLDS